MSKNAWFSGAVGGVLSIAALVFGSPGLAHAESTSDLEALTLEELMNIQVTSVSKRPQKVIQTPAAITVITREDIRRSGHTNVADILRMVPGASVGRYTPKAWAVGIRGDEAQFSRMLLVLVDGRAAYTTAFNGTFWDEIDMPMEDIERIEVIRGPGAAVWGANAVHGVINIIRRRPEDSESFANVLVGTEDRMISSLGYTGSLGEDFDFRISSRYVNRDGFAGRTSNQNQRDGMRNAIGAFRGDLRIGEDKTLTLQGDMYGGDRTGARGRNLTTTDLTHFQTFETTSVRGGNALTRLELRHSETAMTELQLYFDSRFRDLLVVSDDRQIYDFELRNRFRIGKSHDFNWGGGARHISERLGNTLNFVATPENQDEAIYNVYLQDEYNPIPDVLSFSLGSKFEWNTYTGWEVQPTVRALWAPLEHQQFWAAFSRAVRIPSRQDIGEYFNVPAYAAGLPIAFVGTEDHTSEVVLETDLGYRWQPSATLNLDLTAFVRRTQNFQVFVPNATTPSILNQTDISERSSAGAEVSVRWRPVDYWNLVLNYSRIHINHSGRFFSLSGDHSSPANQVGLFSYFDLPGNFELDLFWYYHGPFGTNDNPSVSTEFNGYHRADLRVGWRPTERLEISLVGQNLLDHRHREGLDFFEGSQALTGQPPSEVERAGYIRVGVTF